MLPNIKENYSNAIKQKNLKKKHIKHGVFRFLQYLLRSTLHIYQHINTNTCPPQRLQTPPPCAAVKFILFGDWNADICYLFAYECPPANVCETQLQRSSTVLSEMLKTQQVVAFFTIKSRPTASLCGQNLTWQSKNTGSNFIYSDKFTSKKKSFLTEDLCVPESWSSIGDGSSPSGSMLKTSWWWTPDNSQSELIWLALFWPFMLEIGLFIFLLLGLLQKMMQLS